MSRSEDTSIRGASETVYVLLKNEGVEVYAPAPARRLGNRVFELLEPADYNPSAEEWEFVPGTVVECEERTVGARRALIAVRRASPPRQGATAGPPQ